MDLDVQPDKMTKVFRKKRNDIPAERGTRVILFSMTITLGDIITCNCVCVCVSHMHDVLLEWGVCRS